MKIHSSYLLLVTLFFSACSGVEPATHSSDRNHIPQSLRYTNHYVASDEKKYDPGGDIPLGRRCTFIIDGIGLNQLIAAEGFTRFILLSKQGDTLVYYTTEVKSDSMNKLLFPFATTAAFIPHNQYLIVADYTDKQSGSSLHAEMPFTVSEQEVQPHLDFHNLGFGKCMLFYTVNNSRQTYTTLQANDEINLFVSLLHSDSLTHFPAGSSFRSIVFNKQGKQISNISAEISSDNISDVFGAYLEIEPEWPIDHDTLFWEISLYNSTKEDSANIRLTLPFTD